MGIVTSIATSTTSSGGLNDLLVVVTFVAVGVNITGLLPLPTLSNNEFFFLLVRTVHHGPVGPGCRNCIRTVNFVLLVLLVMIIACGSVIELVGA